jgi:hypothetical protein
MTKKKSTPVKPVGTLPGDRICVSESLSTMGKAALELFDAMHDGKVSQAEANAKLKEIRAADKMIKAELDKERTVIQAARKLVKFARR